MASLYVRAGRDGARWQVWPSAEVIPPGVIHEGSTVYFELTDIEASANNDLCIDDQPLEALRSESGKTTLWRWKPGFNAGIVEVSLRIAGLETSHFEIITDADVRKLTRDDFDLMVREILEDTFALFSLSSFRKGLASRIGNRPPPIARLEFLRTRIQEILDTVAQIGRTPRHFLNANLVTIPLHRARRITGQEIAHSFRLGEVRAERRADADSRLPPILRGHLPTRVISRQRSNSVDTPEHRQIKTALKTWASWLASVGDTLTRITETTELDQKSLTRAWSERARKLSRSLQVASATGFMNDVGDNQATLKLTSLFRREPRYRKFYRLWQDMNLGFAELFGDFLQMPLAKTYQLYELWCFLRLLRAAISEYGSTNADLTNLFTADSSGGLTITSGPVTVKIDATRAICFQRQFKEYWKDPSGEGSFSRTMIPDIVLTGSGFGGSDKHVIVLDAKYRINEGLNDATGSIHVYRDAIVKANAKNELESIVTAAYLVTPHTADLRATFEETTMPSRLFHPDYRRRFQLGAVTLRPGMMLTELQSALRTIACSSLGQP